MNFREQSWWRTVVRAWPWMLATAVAAPALVFRWLPMTDLPQHEAIATILGHPFDPRFGFDTFYRLDFRRSPYVLPYAVAAGLERVVPAGMAMRVIVFASIMGYFAAVLALLRVMQKPREYVLLAVPFAYNRAFFWGFINFQLGVALALLGIAVLADASRGKRRLWVLAILMGAMALTHVYALALFAGFGVLYWLVQRASDRRDELWWALGATLLAGLWLLLEARAPALGGTVWPSLADRIARLTSEILGGYADESEALLLALVLAAFGLVTFTELPFTRARWLRLDAAERALYLVFVGNVIAYFVLPRATPTAKFIHFRHAVLAAMLLPVIAGRLGLARRPFVPRALLVLLGTVALFTTWDHLRLFDREARSFEPVLAAIPDRPRLVYLDTDRNGRIMRTAPYLHFGAYVQAARGGIMTMGFPEIFWNIPVTLRAEARIPATPLGLEWRPQLFDDEAFGYFYDHVLLRDDAQRTIATSRAFPFQLVTASGPWRLYRRALSPDSSASR